MLSIHINYQIWFGKVNVIFTCHMTVHMLVKNVRRHQNVLKNVQKTFKNVRKGLKRSKTRLNVAKMLKSQNARERRRRERKNGGFRSEMGGGAPPPFRQTPHEALLCVPFSSHMIVFGAHHHCGFHHEAKLSF